MTLLRRITAGELPLRTRILIGVAVWLLLIVVLWIGVTNSTPLWLQIVGWVLIIAGNVVISIGYIRWWNARRRRS